MATTMALTERALMPVHWSESWHRTLSQTDGRDKLFRLLQYLLKFVRGLDRGHATPSADTPMGRVAALEGALGTSRQIWRLFKWASVYAKTKPRVLSSSASMRLGVPAIPPASMIPQISGLVSDFALFMYLIMDNVNFIHKANVLKGDVKRSSRRAAKFWMVAVLSGLAGSLYNLVVLHKRFLEMKKTMESVAAVTVAIGAKKKNDAGSEGATAEDEPNSVDGENGDESDENNAGENERNAEGREGEAATNDNADDGHIASDSNMEVHADLQENARKNLARMARQYNAASAVVAKHFADAVVATSLAREEPLHPATVGFFGAVSSAVGLWQVWPRNVSTG